MGNTQNFKSTPPSRPNKAGLDVCRSLRPYVHMYICPSAKSFSDSNEIWCIGRGRWVMHDGMPYGPIQGQDHVAFSMGAGK